MTVALLSITASLVAYEAGTHARLTARAAVASRVDATLRAWGLREGLYQGLRVDVEHLDRRAAFRLRERLARVDPTWGGAADERGSQRALGWLVAGSVLEEAPASRGRHHFLDPRDGSGLVEPRPGIEWLLGAVAGADGEGSLAGALAGTNFTMVGEPADRWAISAENEWSVTTFHRELRSAVLDPDSTRRSAAMARALLALGSVAHVLQDMASPTHVRNDLVGGHLATPDSSTFDRSSRYERFVALAHAEIGPPTVPPPPATALRARFVALATATQRAFFSPGTLPSPVQLLPGTTAERAEAEANAGAPYPEPVVSGIDFRRESGYLAGAGVPHLASYRIDRTGRLRFDLDERCWADQARVLLPWAGAHSTGLLDHLARPGPRVSILSDGTAYVDAASLSPRAGHVVVFWEDEKGIRRELERHAVGAPAQPVAVPTEAVRLGAMLDGLDERGEPVVAARVIDL